MKKGLILFLVTVLFSGVANAVKRVDGFETYAVGYDFMPLEPQIQFTFVTSGNGTAEVLDNCLVNGKGNCAFVDGGTQVFQLSILDVEANHPFTEQYNPDWNAIHFSYWTGSASATQSSVTVRFTDGTSTAGIPLALGNGTFNYMAPPGKIIESFDVATFDFGGFQLDEVTFILE